ncbi:MAG: hypothetical protein WB952_20190 [Terriglobales bacterium]
MHDDDEGRRLREGLGAALARLVADDRDLLLLDANERAITGRLGMYLQELFPEWNVDCEYNRILAFVKEVTVNGEITRVVPDVIVHQRNTGNNLAVFEVKKQGNAGRDDDDRRKLRALRDQLGYRFAGFLKLRTGPENPGVESLEWL